MPDLHKLCSLPRSGRARVGGKRYVYCHPESVENPFLKNVIFELFRILPCEKPTQDFTMAGPVAPHPSLPQAGEGGLNKFRVTD